jgi:alanine racemase
MKKFIIINGTKVRIIERISMDKAIESAENTCDHSKEIIVREITEITDHTKVYENIP